MLSSRRRVGRTLGDAEGRIRMRIRQRSRGALKRHNVVCGFIFALFYLTGDLWPCCNVVRGLRKRRIVTSMFSYFQQLSLSALLVSNRHITFKNYTFLYEHHFEFVVTYVLFLNRGHFPFQTHNGK